MRIILLLTCLFLLHVHLSAQLLEASVISDQLLQFEGRWKLIPSSLEVIPAPPDLDTSSFALEMRCSIGPDSLSIHCQFSGNKELIGQKVISGGQELLVYEPQNQVVYKLSGIRNLAEMENLNGMFVTIGKGIFERKDYLSITEYLAGNNGPAGKHIYEWLEGGQLKESSQYFDQDGKKVRESSWIMQKVQEP